MLFRSPVNEIWRKYGISSATYYKWKAKYGGLEASDIKRLKELEYENGRLKREVATHLVPQSGLPVQWACAAVGLSRARRTIGL